MFKKRLEATLLAISCLIDAVSIGGRLDSMILEVFSKLNDSVILFIRSYQKYFKPSVQRAFYTEQSQSRSGGFPTTDISP